MSLLKKLFGRKGAGANGRVRVCLECGMPVPSHKEWCAILRGEKEMELRAAASAGSSRALDTK
jgi:hypothetical protein